VPSNVDLLLIWRISIHFLQVLQLCVVISEWDLPGHQWDTCIRYVATFVGIHISCHYIPMYSLAPPTFVNKIMLCRMTTPLHDDAHAMIAC
jgi:hypothetical protein